MELQIDTSTGRGLLHRHARKAAGLVGCDRVDITPLLQDLCQRVLLARRGELVAQTRAFVLGDEGLAVLDDRHAKRVRVDTDNNPRLRAAGSATGEESDAG